MNKLKLAGIITAIGITAFATVAYANPSFFASSASTSTATTTPTFLAANTAIATTTLPIYDSYEVGGTNQTNQGKINVPDEVNLAIQFTASSTTSVLGWKYEYSQDGIDWYEDDYMDAGRLSTSSIVNVSAGYTQTWTFASSTVGGQTPAASNQISGKLVTVPVPMRYVRVVFYSASTARGAVWATFIPQKQN